MTQHTSSRAGSTLDDSAVKSAGQRGYVCLSGPGSRTFLQGQVTCDINGLTPDNSVKGAHCTAKGRIVFLFTAHCDLDDNLILQTHPSIVDIAIASLKKYAVFFKTEISDVSAQYTCEEGHSDQADLIRLRAGIADVVAETSEMFIPQMLNLDALGYISFKKGCYTGQEIVARAHYRGAVKRRMYHLKLTTQAVPLAGDEIKNNEGQSIGNIASAMAIDSDNIEALAVLSDKHSDCEGLQIGDQPLLDVSYLPLPYEIPTTP